MKAALITKHGGSEVLEVKEVDKPTIEPDEVLIKVYYSALNRLDLFVRNGSPNLKIPLPHISGSDFVGEVVELGETVKNVILGDVVATNAVNFCNSCDQCLRGEHSLCENFSMIGEHKWGGLAEFVKVPSRNVITIPRGIDLKSVTALGLTGLTAWRMLSTRAKLRPGEIVVIPGAAGGLSVAGIQIAKLFGAKVIALTSTVEKEKFVKSVGADITLNYKSLPNWSKKIRELTNGSGADVIFESVGEATWTESLKSLKKGGRLVTAGATTGFSGKTNIGAIFWFQQSILGSTMGNMKEFQEVLALIFSGKLTAYIDKEYPLDKIKEAEEYLESGKQMGKILISINPE